MALAIGVLVSILSLGVGYIKMERQTAAPGRAVILTANADLEGLSTISRDVASKVMAMPGIGKSANGNPLADSEYYSGIRINRKPTGTNLLALRGIGRQGLELRPELHIVAGRMFRAGARELVMGIAAQENNNLNVGDKVIMPDGEWPIVGSFTTGGDLVEGQIIGDVDTLMSAEGKKSFSSVTVRLDGPGALDILNHALAENPALNVRAERQSDYYERTSEDNAAFFRVIGYAVGGIMALGVLFGTLNTMYSAVAARTEEIGTLRALGFGGAAVAISVITESLLLALIGALFGESIAWLVFNGDHYAFGLVLFDLTVSPGLMGLGIAWALVVAFLGGLFPSIRAARLPIIEALRAT